MKSVKNGLKMDIEKVFKIENGPYLGLKLTKIQVILPQKNASCHFRESSTKSILFLCVLNIKISLKAQKRDCPLCSVEESRPRNSSRITQNGQKKGQTRKLTMEIRLLLTKKKSQIF